MKLILFLYSYLFLVTFFGYSFRNEISFVDKWDTIRVVKNPYKGWYQYCSTIIHNLK